VAAHHCASPRISQGFYPTSPLRPFKRCDYTALIPNNWSALVEKMLTPAELVNRWNGAITVPTLANWRWVGKGPSFVKLGTKVVYPETAVIAYEKRNTTTTHICSR
jgi:hypothetical protein